VGAPGMFSGSGVYDGSYEIDRIVHEVTRYAELCDDAVTRVSYEDGEEARDPRVVMLKAVGKGVYLKEVGVMISDTEFLLYESRD